MENQKTFFRFVVGILAIPVSIGVTTSASAQTPLSKDFTYQGQLKQNGEPVNDTADFQVTLMDAGKNGNQVGSMVQVLDVDVVDGLFTIQLDFGVVAFNGDDRWVELSVRSPAGGGDYVTLAPRQPLTATPLQPADARSVRGQ